MTVILCLLVGYLVGRMGNRRDDGVIRGIDAEAIAKEIRDGTPNTPERVAMLRKADRIYANATCVAMAPPKWPRK